MFDLKLAMIKRISNAIFSKDHNRFEKNVLELFIAHRIEFPDLKKDKEAIEMLTILVKKKPELYEANKMLRRLIN